jgi:predicted nuclease with TOPRIM domain
MDLDKRFEQILTLCEKNAKENAELRESIVEVKESFGEIRAQIALNSMSISRLEQMQAQSYLEMNELRKAIKATTTNVNNLMKTLVDNGTIS